MKKWFFDKDIPPHRLGLILDGPADLPDGAVIAGHTDNAPHDSRRFAYAERGHLPSGADALIVREPYNALLIAAVAADGRPVLLDITYTAQRDLLRAAAALSGQRIALLHALRTANDVWRAAAFADQLGVALVFGVGTPPPDDLLRVALAASLAQEFAAIMAPAALVPDLVARAVPLIEEQASALLWETHPGPPVLALRDPIAAGEIITPAHLTHVDAPVAVSAPLEVVSGRAAARDLPAGPLRLSDVDLRVGGLIQVRTASSRLPGKATMPLGGQNALEHVIDRARLAKTLDTVIVCTTDQPEDASLVPVAEGKGVPIFRGSEMNVIRRFVGAADAHHIDVIVRITGDSPLIDAEVIDGPVRHHLAHNADYTHVVGLPVGVAVEVFNTAALRHAQRLSEDPAVSEDLTYYLRRPSAFNVARWQAPEHLNAPDLVIALNRPEDAQVIRQVFEALEDPDAPPFRLQDTIAWLRAHPAVAGISADYTPKPTICNVRFAYRNLTRRGQDATL